MGLIKAALGATGGVLADQWKEYFYCEAIPSDVLAVKGRKKATGRSSNKHGDDNIITNGSVIAIADGQCMLIVEQGKVVDVCAEPGEYTYDMSTEPSIFSGDLGDSVKSVFQNIGKRFTFGGEAPKDQRIYYFNTKELTGNKYGTPSPVPFRVVDQRAGIDLDIGIRCFGEYSIRLKNPLLFYTNVCGNVSEDYKTENIAGQMKTELLTALQPAFAKISEMGIRYSALPGHTLELADALISMKEEAGFPHYIRGMVLNGVDRYEEAIREYTAALAQQPDEHYIWYALGACYEELGDLQNAQQAFQISLDIMPKIGSSHTGDWTGVSVHAGFALERVRGQLAQGGN